MVQSTQKCQLDYNDTFRCPKNNNNLVNTALYRKRHTWIDCIVDIRLVSFSVLFDIYFPFSSRTTYIPNENGWSCKKNIHFERQWNDCVFWASMIFCLCILWQNIDFNTHMYMLIFSPTKLISFWGLKFYCRSPGLLLIYTQNK